MSKKVGRNDPCWCGSGKKYKHCHLRREQAPRPTKQEALNELKRSMKKYCLHPHASRENCEGSIIKAHTIQRGGGLSRIAENGHVYMPEARYGKFNLSMNKIGLKEATTFTGFCNKHDAQTFRPIETNPFESNEEHCFLLGYRAICHELYKKRSVNELIDSFLSTADRGLSLPEQMGFQSVLNDFDLGTSEAIKDLELFKQLYDKALIAQDYSEVRYYVIRFKNVPDFLCTSALLPEIDFKGNILQDLYEATIQRRRLDYFTYSLIATDSGGAAVFSWLGDAEPCNRFIDSLDQYVDEQIPNTLLRFTFEFAENTAVAPAWWDNLPKNIQDQILTRIRIAAIEERASDCLIDDDVKALDWIVDCRETNLAL